MALLAVMRVSEPASPGPRRSPPPPPPPQGVRVSVSPGGGDRKVVKGEHRMTWLSRAHGPLAKWDRWDWLFYSILLTWLAVVFT